MNRENGNRKVFVGKNIKWKNYNVFPWSKNELMMGQSKKYKDFFQKRCGSLPIIGEKIISSTLKIDGINVMSVTFC